jgi:hypothetical protein
VSIPKLGTERNSAEKISLQGQNNLLRIESVFSSAKCFGKNRGMDWNYIQRVCFFFFHGTEFITFFSSAEGFRTKFLDLASIFDYFLFHSTEFRAFFSSAKWFGTKF